MPERNPTLLGQCEITGEIHLMTGLHIGGNDSGIAIGGVDKVVVRNSFTNQPIIPGSSLKGKLRSLMEKARSKPQNKTVKKSKHNKRAEEIRMHQCETMDEYNRCAVCNLFGVPSNWEDKNPPYPTRIVVRDARLEDAEELYEKTELPYTEAKTEVSIDRLTSMANPRNLERVPAGAKFILEMMVNIYQERDIELLSSLIFAMALLEKDFLGGHGSRGYGQVLFKNLGLNMNWFGDSDQMPRLPVWEERIKEYDQGCLFEHMKDDFKSIITQDPFENGASHDNISS